MGITREELSIIEKVASKVAQGYNAQKIAIEADLDIGYVEKIIALPDFDEVFQTLDPKAYRKWKDNQADLVAKRQVMTMAQEDSVEHYKMARDLIRGSRDLSDKDRLNGLLDLLKFAKVSEGIAAREVVELSKDNLDTILEAWDETD